ncbi:MAG: hypothetical protein K2W96_06115 [Gemmataceae bacterium]|nr:hypothetical protein [Gemmataceae bacterium]
MIFNRPAADAPLDQGDIIEDCPILSIASFIADNPSALEVQHAFRRVVILTQTCTLLSK